MLCKIGQGYQYRAGGAEARKVGRGGKVTVGVDEIWVVERRVAIRGVHWDWGEGYEWVGPE